MEARPEAAEFYMIPFHAGQFQAFTGNYAAAVPLMQAAYTDEASSELVDWEAFVDANIAFLQRDMPSLLTAKKRIEKQRIITRKDIPDAPEWMYDKKINLDVVEAFIRCFDESYDYAYHGCRGL